MFSTMNQSGEFAAGESETATIAFGTVSAQLEVPKISINFHLGQTGGGKVVDFSGYDVKGTRPSVQDALAKEGHELIQLTESFYSPDSFQNRV